jgi:alpha-tubulin suppressor-like RCC1 family protein
VVKETFVSIQNVKEISTRLDHILYLTTSNQVWSSGKNTYGQLGLNDTNARVVPERIPLDNITQISAGGSFSLCLDNSMRVYKVSEEINLDNLD